MSSLVPFLLGLLAAAGIVIPLLLRLRTRAAEADEHADDLEEEAAQLRKNLAQAEQTHSSLSQFLKDFPHLARELFQGLTDRQLPGAILRLVQKSLEPAQACVLIRRGEGESARLIVAATFPEGGVPRIGSEIPADRGEAGFVLESRLVTGRAELALKQVQERIKPGAEGAEGVGGFQPALYAPLVFGQDALGLIALSPPRRVIGDGKAALRLIAQTGAHALHVAAAYSRVRVTAEVDGLTNAYNKRHVEQVLSDLIYRAACAAYDRRADSGSGTLSIFLFDLDQFKHYNDTNGHLAGDKLLQELAGMIQTNIRQDDIFGRFGGEEFLLVMPETNLAEALNAANKLRSAITARAFPFADKQPMGFISVSGGVAEYPADGMDAATLLHAADEALYEAKRQGRNLVMAAARPGGAAAAAAADEARQG